jgi:chorismate mutase/prephenate dehydrogenase
MDASDRLSSLRAQIRALDDKIIGLIAERQAVAKEIGAHKVAAGLPIKDYRVEREVIGRAKERARHAGIQPSLAAELAELLIHHSVAAQDELHRQASRAKSTAAKRILVVGGCGRMGGWLSDYFDAFGHAVAHLDATTTSAPHACTYPRETDLADAARRSDIVVLSTPISATPALIEALAASGTRALVFDICSLKTPLIPALRAAAAKGLRIASAHPMFGPSVDVLAGRNILVCDTGDASLTAETQALFAPSSAVVTTIPLERHDALMSYVLGLSHLTSLVFGETLSASGFPPEVLRQAASTTFLAQVNVTAPVVGENQDLYYEIQAENASTPQLFAELASALERYRAAVRSRDRTGFRALMEKARQFLDTSRTRVG